MKLEQRTDGGGETLPFNERAVNKKINLDPSPPTSEILVIIAANLSRRVLSVGAGFLFSFFQKIRLFRPSSFRH